MKNVKKKDVIIATERVVTKTTYEGNVYCSPNVYGDNHLVSTIDFNGRFRGISLDIIAHGDIEVKNSKGKVLTKSEKTKLFSGVDDFYMLLSDLNLFNEEGESIPKELKKYLKYDYDLVTDTYFEVKVYYCGTHVDLMEDGLMEGIKFKHLFHNFDVISESLVAFNYTRGIRMGLIDTDSETFKEFSIVLDRIMTKFNSEKIISIEEDFNSKFDEFITNFKNKWAL